MGSARDLVMPRGEIPVDVLIELQQTTTTTSPTTPTTAPHSLSLSLSGLAFLSLSCHVRVQTPSYGESVFVCFSLSLSTKLFKNSLSLSTYFVSLSCLSLSFFLSRTFSYISLPKLPCPNPLSLSVSLSIAQSPRLLCLLGS